MVEGPSPGQFVEGAALEGAEHGGIGHAPPEAFKGGTGARGAVVCEAADHDGRIHCAGRRARDAFDLQAGFFQQAVEYAPCKRTVRPAALQGEIDQQGSVLAWFFRDCGWTRHRVSSGAGHTAGYTKGGWIAKKRE